MKSGKGGQGSTHGGARPITESFRRFGFKLKHFCNLLWVSSNPSFFAGMDIIIIIIILAHQTIKLSLVCCMRILTEQECF